MTLAVPNLSDLLAPREDYPGEVQADVLRLYGPLKAILTRIEWLAKDFARKSNRNYSYEGTLTPGATSPVGALNVFNTRPLYDVEDPRLVAEYISGLEGEERVQAIVDALEAMPKPTYVSWPSKRWFYDDYRRYAASQDPEHSGIIRVYGDWSLEVRAKPPGPNVEVAPPRGPEEKALVGATLGEVEDEEGELNPEGLSFGD